MTSGAITSTAAQIPLGPVSVRTYTKPDRHFGTQHCVVMGAALAAGNGPVVVFSHADDIATVHISATGEVHPYTDTSLDTLLTFFLGESCSADLYDAEVFASPGQADYAGRVLALLIPHLPDLQRWSPQAKVEFLVDRLAARAERHLWCVKDKQDGTILHAYVDGYNDHQLYRVVDDYDAAAHESYLNTLDVDADEDVAAFEPQGEHRLQVHRVPESDIPPHVKIVGCNWARDPRIHQASGR